MTTWTYKRGQELPDPAFEWRDDDDVLIDFSSGWTFTVLLVRATTGKTVVSKTTGIVGAATSPNVVIQWDSGELDIAPGEYRIEMTARRVSDSKDRPYKPEAEPTVVIQPLAT